MTIYARLRRLTEPHEEDVDQTFQRLADLLRDSGRTASVRCTILVAHGRRSWTFDLHGSECRVYRVLVNAPELEIITSEATWWDIAEGRLAPLEAFTGGRLRVLGDTDLASHLLRHVTEASGAPGRSSPASFEGSPQRLACQAHP